MKRKILSLIVVCSFSLTLLSQEFITATRSVTEIEYEITHDCDDDYLRALSQVFKIKNLVFGRTYSFEITDPQYLDNIDNIQFDGHPTDWDIVLNNGQYQEWLWEGSNGASDYINVDVYIEDYSDIELGSTQSFAMEASYQDFDGIFLDTCTSSIEIYTPTIIDGPFLYCSNPVEFELEDMSVDGSASWVIKQSGITKASGNGINASANNITTGSGIVVYTISFPCGLEDITISKDFWFGKFESAVVTGQGGVCPSSLYMYTAQVPGGHKSSYSYTWTYPSNWSKYSQYNNFVHLYTSSNPNYGTVRAAITNSCGTSGYTGITVYPGYNCGGYYMMMPNPSSTYIDLDVESQKRTAFAAMTDNDISISIIDKMGTAVYSDNVTSLPFRIDTNKFRKGEYIARILTISKVGSEKVQRVESIKFIVE